MSFTYSFSFVPVSLETYGHTHNCINWKSIPLNRPLLPGSKWRWMWHPSGTQSGWRWRFVGNSREERVHDRTASANSPTLPRAVRWKTAESLPVLTHSRWVWQTPEMSIHHYSSYPFLLACKIDKHCLIVLWALLWILMNSAPDSGIAALFGLGTAAINTF